MISSVQSNAYAGYQTYGDPVAPMAVRPAGLSNPFIKPIEGPNDGEQMWSGGTGGFTTVYELFTQYVRDNVQEQPPEQRASVTDLFNELNDLLKAYAPGVNPALGDKQRIVGYTLNTLEPNGPLIGEKGCPIRGLQVSLLGQFMFMQKTQQDIGDLIADPEGKENEW